MPDGGEGAGAGTGSGGGGPHHRGSCTLRRALFSAATTRKTRATTDAWTRTVENRLAHLTKITMYRVQHRLHCIVKTQFEKIWKATLLSVTSNEVKSYAEKSALFWTSLLLDQGVLSSGPSRRQQKLKKAQIFKQRLAARHSSIHEDEECNRKHFVW
ncbi:Protein of unknown function [Gryllus bimaculatus]|nr:Protein of unknown function [Gryllus bimaculatus]